MNETIRRELIRLAESRQNKTDPSHDFEHVLRVFHMAEIIAQKEKADLDVVIPAALFHDTVVYPKNSPQSRQETEESAEVAGEILAGFTEYPSEKIPQVKQAITECSFRKAIVPVSLESRVLQDADLLESTGAISILRTFSSGGQMNRPFYVREDPFCEKEISRSPSNLDLFYDRLLIAHERLHSPYAKLIGKRRADFLHTFLAELRLELKESGVVEG